MRNPINFEDYINDIEPHRIIRHRVLTDLQELQTIYPAIFARVYEEMFGTTDFDEVIKTDNDDNFHSIFKFRGRIQKAIDLEKSFIDVDKLTRVLQQKDGMAFQAFTDYTCKICGTDGRWHNGNTPDFCDECAKKLAIHIAKYADKIIKE